MAQLTLMGRLGRAASALTGRDMTPAPPRSGQFSRSYDQWFADALWLAQIAINDDKVLQLEGGGDMTLYERLLDDDKVMGAFQQRRLAVISRPWAVEAGADDDQSKKAAEHLRQTIKAMRWDDVTEKMLYARWFGYAVGEAIWGTDDDGLWVPNKIVIPDRKWFGFTNQLEARMRTPTDIDGLPLPDRKFWIVRAGGSHDFMPYGMGLAHWCYWPVWFKRNGIRFWALFLEKFGMPTAVGKFPESADDTFKARLLDTLQAIGTEAAVTIPEDVEIELMEASRTAAGASSYEQFRGAMNEALEIIILGQTMTSRAGPAGLGSSQADVHKDVRDEIVVSDSDLTSESFNESIVKWMTEWNFPGAKPPRVYREMSDPEDLDTLATRDKTLSDLGWELNEEAFKDRYGEGYQKKQVQVPPAFQPGRPGFPQLLPPNPKLAQFAVGDPKPLYVSRKVVNAAELTRWAKAAGIQNVESDLHVTILYSRSPVVWAEMGRSWSGDPKTGNITIEPGGPREVGRFTDMQTAPVVLYIPGSYELDGRHDCMVERGASHDFDGYKAHITISYDPGSVDLEALEPYQGPIVLGPEIFEDLDTTPDGGETAFSAEQLDEIDAVVSALLADAAPTFTAMLRPIAVKLKGVKDPAALRVALLEAAEKMPTDKFAAVMKDLNVAVRATAEAGIGEAPPLE